MNYYILKPDYNPQIIGNVFVPQSEKIIGGLINNEAYLSLSNYWKNEPVSKPISAMFLLKKNAKLTDYISVMHGNSLYGIIIFDKLYEYLKIWELPEYYAIPVEFTYDQNLTDIISNYYLFICKNSIFSYVNFEKSRFKINSIMNDFQQSIVINSVTDIVEFRVSKNESEWHHKLDFEKLVLMKDCNFDIFRIGEGMGGYYVSEKLKETIEEAGFTGMRFEEAPNIIREE